MPKHARAMAIIRRLTGWVALGFIPSAACAEPVDYLRDVKPILRERCHVCHGAIQQEAGLRLDTGKLILRGGDSGAVIQPGEAENSLLLTRISASNGAERMPPEGEPLTKVEIDLIHRWISQGALSPEDEQPQHDPRRHWAFLAPRRSPLPSVRQIEWPSRALDYFVLARLEQENLAPSPPADRATLLRRLSLDLLGLPPTPVQLAEVQDDPSPDWYEQLVDRMLASPHFGERWGKHWLDLTRFADSDGHSGERVRPHAWRYRDWVIDSINQDLPFDRFTIQQLAGDLLPNAGPGERTAAGLHRHALTSRETCVDEEEKRVRVVTDRTIATGDIWLGLTVACCQCHTHKYDPLTHREFFGLYAFFDNLEDIDLSLKIADGETAFIPTVQESDTRRTTYVHRRGDFRQPSEAVEPHTFEVLPAMRPRGERPDRLDLARWVVDRRNPLTARVAVNQVWRHLLGEGLVATVNDFGTRGQPPSHPELLDWLAVEFMDRGWSRKELIRQIVLSATYQQSSAHRSELLDRDPENRWLARQNRFRLEGEIIRDIALAAAGKLDLSLGGPSFRPPVPPDAGHGVLAQWKPDETEETRRRGLYVLMQRTVPHPLWATLDVPDGNTPCLQRTRANTPIQALTLMNDPLFFHAAQALGQRVHATPGSFADRLRVLFQPTIGRLPTELEQRQLETLYQVSVTELLERPETARRWSGLVDSAVQAEKVAEQPDEIESQGPDQAVEVVQAAAWVVLAQTVLNLDELITRE